MRWPVGSRTVSFNPKCKPWNKGKSVGQKRPFKQPDVEAIRAALESESRIRELAMFNLAIDSKLRASDLVKMKVEDISIRGRVRDRALVVQKKTGKPVQFEIVQKTQNALEKWIQVAKLERGYLFPSKRRADQPVTTRTYARIVDGWARLAGLEPSLYGTHTLRRTKATFLYRQTRNLRAVQLLLGHKSIENTVRYLGVDMDDALELSAQAEL